VDPKLQRRVQRYGWDKAAGHYERYWAEQLRPAQERMLAMAALKPGDRVLDVACGTGLATFAAAAAVAPGGEVVGTDISEEMVQAGRRLAAERGAGHVRFERMEAEALAFDEGAFDVVLCALGLMYVTDFEGTIRGMRRVAAPGGRVVSAVWGRRDRCGWAEIFPIVDARVNTDVCPLFFQLGTGDLLAELYRTAGLGGVATERISVPLRYANGEDACGAAFAGGPVAMAYSRFDERTRAEAHAAYLASIEPYRNGGDYAIPGEFVVVRGVREGASS